MRTRSSDAGSSPQKEFVPEEPMVALPTELRRLGPIELVVVGKHCPQEHWRWREALERFHPQGHVALPQAHVRYLIRCRYGELAVLCFGAAARQLAARDTAIGWSKQARAGARRGSESCDCVEVGGGHHAVLCRGGGRGATGAGAVIAMWMCKVIGQGGGGAR